MCRRTDRTKLCVDCNVKYRTHKTCCRDCSCVRSRAYEKTPKGYLVRTYRNMYNRVHGLPRNKAHLYEGLPICDKHRFYSWSLSKETEFLSLLDDYKANGYDFTFAPSIDRIIPSEGYVFGNIRWVTQSVNSAKTSQSKGKTLPVGINNSGKGKVPFKVSKYVKGVHFWKSFSNEEDAKNYLDEITR